MDIFEEFQDMKAGLREKWLDYYEINAHWIQVTSLRKGQSWNEAGDGQAVTLYCPDSKLIIGAIGSLDKRVADFIYVSMRLSGQYNLDKIVEGLGLRFDPDIALEERAEETEDEEDDIENEQVKVDNLGLEQLRREASQLMNNS